MKKSKKRPQRTERRIAERDARKRIEDRVKLAALEEGGAPERPIEVESASVIETTAASSPCVACDGRVRVEEHQARTLDGVPVRVVRVVRVRCGRCGHERTTYFRIVARMPN